MNQIVPLQTRDRPPHLPAIIDREASDQRRMLKAIGAITGPRLVPFDEHYRFRQRTDTLFFMRIGNHHHYVPRSLTRETVDLVERGIMPRPNPGDQQRHAAALGNLYTLTLSTKRTPQERDHLLNTYLSKLARYPAWITEHVLDGLSSSCKFFPAWSEISGPISELAGWRHDAVQRLHDTLSNIANKPKG